MKSDLWSNCYSREISIKRPLNSGADSWKHDFQVSIILSMMMMMKTTRRRSVSSLFSDRLTKRGQGLRDTYHNIHGSGRFDRFQSRNFVQDIKCKCRVFLFVVNDDDDRSVEVTEKKEYSRDKNEKSKSDSESIMETEERESSAFNGLWIIPQWLKRCLQRMNQDSLRWWTEELLEQQHWDPWVFDTIDSVHFESEVPSDEGEGGRDDKMQRKEKKISMEIIQQQSLDERREEKAADSSWRDKEILSSLKIFRRCHQLNAGAASLLQRKEYSQPDPVSCVCHGQSPNPTSCLGSRT